jgi:hypothetical protein
MQCQLSCFLRNLCITKTKIHLDATTFMHSQCKLMFLVWNDFHRKKFLIGSRDELEKKRTVTVV